MAKHNDILSHFKTIPEFDFGNKEHRQVVGILSPSTFIAKIINYNKYNFVTKSLDLCELRYLDGHDSDESR